MTKDNISIGLLDYVFERVCLAGPTPRLLKAFAAFATTMTGADIALWNAPWSS